MEKKKSCARYGAWTHDPQIKSLMLYHWANRALTSKATQSSLFESCETRMFLFQLRSDCLHLQAYNLLGYTMVVNNLKTFLFHSSQIG